MTFLLGSPASPRYLIFLFSKLESTVGSPLGTRRFEAFDFARARLLNEFQVDKTNRPFYMIQTVWLLVETIRSR